MTKRTNVRKGPFLSLTAILAALLLIAPSGASADQLGIYPHSTGYTTAVRARIYQPSQTINGTLNRVYQIGVTFPDGYFFQAGIVDGSPNNPDLTCSNGLSWWVTALDSSNHSPFPKVWYDGPCTLLGRHWFRLENVTSSASTTSWQWMMDGNLIGSVLVLPNDQYHFHKDAAITFTEVVNQGSTLCTWPNDCPVEMPSDIYEPTISFPSSGGGWHAPNHASAYRSQSFVQCPPFYIAITAQDDVQVGKSPSALSSECAASGTNVW